MFAIWNGTFENAKQIVDEYLRPESYNFDAKAALPSQTNMAAVSDRLPLCYDVCEESHFNSLQRTDSHTLQF